MIKKYTNDDIIKRYQKLTGKSKSKSTVNRWIKKISKNKAETRGRKQYINEDLFYQVLIENIERTTKTKLDIDSINELKKDEDYIPPEIQKVKDSNMERYQQLYKEDIKNFLGWKNNSVSKSEKHYLELNDLVLNDMEEQFNNYVRQKFDEFLFKVKRAFMQQIDSFELLSENRKKLKSDVYEYCVSKTENMVSQRLIELCDNNFETGKKEYEKEINDIKNNLRRHPEVYFDKTPREIYLKKELEAKKLELQVNCLFKEYTDVTNEKFYEDELEKDLEKRLNLISDDITGSELNELNEKLNVYSHYIK
ncbi:hypothetical protein C6A25_04390 [Streptococcus anginosus]|uniref:hypothetical protein n=1 Tax=Streptococcus anginosus TaxID=1328 RepID=UPI000D044CFA|nr:hypothetical protein [Streptococcus anginosus]PRT76129.1 hypothetical protein C6A25_04390 [Streptococcus anginosus]